MKTNEINKIAEILYSWFNNKSNCIRELNKIAESNSVYANKIKTIARGLQNAESQNDWNRITEQFFIENL